MDKACGRRENCGGHHQKKNGGNAPETVFPPRWRIPPRGVEPLEANQQPLEKSALTQNENPVLATGLDKILQEDADLRALIEAWPGLPEQIKTAIKALIESHRVEKK